MSNMSPDSSAVTTQAPVSTTATSTTGQPLVIDKATKRRVAAASTIGTTIEFYDFYAYATAAVSVVYGSGRKNASSWKS